jgi:kynurenine formamidase
MTLFNLTQTVRDGMPVYPGDLPVRLRVVRRVETDGFANSELVTGMHAGTHLDSPGHFISGAPPLNKLPPGRFILSAKLVDVQGLSEISEEVLSGLPLPASGAVLFRTGWSRFFGQPNYFDDHPVLTPGLAIALCRRGVSMVGLDVPSPDRPPYPVHRILLGNGILILENLTGLETLPSDQVFRLYALPLMVEADSAPVRVIAEVPD